MGTRGAGAGSGLYLLQLGWIAKLLPCTSHSPRLTHPLTEPVIPCGMTGELVSLGGERDHAGGRKLDVPPALQGGERSHFLCMLPVLLFSFHQQHDNQVHTREGIALLPGQTQMPQMPGRPEGPRIDGFGVNSGYHEVSLNLRDTMEIFGFQILDILGIFLYCTQSGLVLSLCSK